MKTIFHTLARYDVNAYSEGDDPDEIENADGQYMDAGQVLAFAQKQQAVLDHLVAALQFCAEHAYAGGKRFADVEIVRDALLAAGVTP